MKNRFKPQTSNLQPQTILITGANGQLGNKLIEVLDKNHNLILTDSDTMDITDLNATESKIMTEKPDFIIHAAAYTKVDQAEEDKELCYKINALGTKNVASAAKKAKATLIYISTDFVFDGQQKTDNGKRLPYTEVDPPKPLSVYGQTKLDGENFIQEICDKYYIIRAAWLFGELPAGHPGSNFVETMLRLASERDSLSVVNDQVGSPTYTGDLAKFVDFLINKNPESGIYHFSGEGETSWYGFAKEIFDLSASHPEFISGSKHLSLKPITSAEYPSKAKRPPYSYLSKEKVESLGFVVRPWQEMLKEYLKNRKNR